MAQRCSCLALCLAKCRILGSLAPALTRQLVADAIEKDVDNGCGVKREDLAEKQSAHHRDSQGTANLGPDTLTRCEGDTSEQRRHGGHHDGTKAQQAGLVNCLCSVQTVFSLRLQREVDDHDAVLLDNTDEQDDAD